MVMGQAEQGQGGDKTEQGEGCSGQKGLCSPGPAGFPIQSPVLPDHLMSEARTSNMEN